LVRRRPGFSSSAFTQGKYDSRLHHVKEIPAGTCLIHLESGTDAFLDEAKRENVKKMIEVARAYRGDGATGKT
jgi:hypothetical protein